MDKIGQKIRIFREIAEMPLRKLAAKLDIDASTLSKIERSERKTNKEMLQKIAEIFEINYDELIIDFLSDEISQKLYDEQNSVTILKIAEQKIEYLKKQK
jgi:transcriptional regulator with XRE-family HTH domain